MGRGHVGESREPGAVERHLRLARHRDDDVVEGARSQSRSDSVDLRRARQRQPGRGDFSDCHRRTGGEVQPVDRRHRAPPAGPEIGRMATTGDPRLPSRPRNASRSRRLLPLRHAQPDMRWRTSPPRRLSREPLPNPPIAAPCRYGEFNHAGRRPNVPSAWHVPAALCAQRGEERQTLAVEATPPPLPSPPTGERGRVRGSP